VIRHRGASRDEDGKWIPGSDVLLTPMVVAPGGGTQSAQRLREGETIACTVYFAGGTDIKNSDELTVGEERYTIIVNDWSLSGRGGMEVLCTRGQG
jgi:hypothetical protein